MNDHPLRAMKQELELHHHCEELRLKLLSEAHIVDYLARRFSGDTFESLAPVIYERTEGNPLFMVNLVDYLDSTQLLSEVASAEFVSLDLIGVPDNIRRMIERNFERLTPEDQAVLQAASVAGTEFSATAVAAALERQPEEVEVYCVRLAQREQFLAAREPIRWPD